MPIAMTQWISEPIMAITEVGTCEFTPYSAVRRARHSVNYVAEPFDFSPE